MKTMTHRLTFILGFLVGLAAALALLVVLAQNSGAGWEQRHRLSVGDV